MMIEFGCYTDPFVLAVLFNNFESVKRFLESENYNPEVLKDITKSVLGAHIPVYYISAVGKYALVMNSANHLMRLHRKIMKTQKRLLHYSKIVLV